MTKGTLTKFMLLCTLVGCSRSTRLEDVFSDVSFGVPAYQSLETFTRPQDAVKGDYLSLDFVQSSAQFREFISKLGVAETNLLSPAGVQHIAAASKINPKYPWSLSVMAEALPGVEPRYRVHVEGRRPYD